MRERVALLTFLAVLGITVAKLAVYALTSSMAAFTEFVDSVTDIATSALALLSVRLSRKPPDEDHHYGHGKAEALAGYTIGLFAGVSLAYVVAELVKRVLEGYIVRSDPLAVQIAAAIVAVDSGLAGVNYLGYRASKSVALRANAVNYMGDSLRALGVLTAITTAWLDPFVTAVLASILAVEVLHLLRESTSILMDEASEELTRRIAESLRGVEEVEEVRKIRVRHSGTHYQVDVVVAVKGGKTIEEAHRAADEVEKRVKAALGAEVDVLVHVEPC